MFLQRSDERDLAPLTAMLTKGDRKMLYSVGGFFVIFIYKGDVVLLVIVAVTSKKKKGVDTNQASLKQI